MDSLPFRRYIKVYLPRNIIFSDSLNSLAFLYGSGIIVRMNKTSIQTIQTKQTPKRKESRLLREYRKWAEDPNTTKVAIDHQWKILLQETNIFKKKYPDYIAPWER